MRMRVPKRARRTCSGVSAWASHDIASRDCRRIGSGGCQLATKLNGVWLVDRWICMLYEYVGGCTNDSEFLQCLVT